MQITDLLQVLSFGTLGSLIVGAAASVLFILLRERSRSSYDELRHRAVLSDVRESYESRLARLTERLVATEERWKDVNHLLITSQTKQSQEEDQSRDYSFVRSLGINPQSIAVSENLIFLLTPFTTEEDPVYRVVQKVCQENGMLCVRGDETHIAGDILTNIVKTVLQARIVIANISSRNPNVFYELGIAHALDKSTILLAKTIESAPFDVQSRKIVLFSDLNDLDRKLTGALLRAYRQV